MAAPLIECTKRELLTTRILWSENGNGWRNVNYDKIRRKRKVYTWAESFKGEQVNSVDSALSGRISILTYLR